MKNPLPDCDTLSRLLRYDAGSGKLYWRERMSQRVKAGDAAGSLTPGGYITVKVCGKTFFAHRIIWKMLHGAAQIQLDGKKRHLGCFGTEAEANAAYAAAAREYFGEFARAA